MEPVRQGCRRSRASRNTALHSSAGGSHGRCSEAHENHASSSTATPRRRTAGREPTPQVVVCLPFCNSAAPFFLRLPSMQLETAASQERLSRFSVHPHPALRWGRETSAGRGTNQHHDSPPHTTSRPMDNPPDHHHYHHPPPTPFILRPASRGPSCIYCITDCCRSQPWTGLVAMSSSSCSAGPSRLPSPF
ncbi:hypothetical protein LZ32DRAFT_383338 [Colletotrichum eremochloae]|nr:hypothetical protein LZ32DRAFT_383338 [Colletotrichum eremochloae]